MKKALVLLCLALFFSANAFALAKCPQKSYFEIVPGYSGTAPSVPAFSSMIQIRGCGMAVGDETFFYAKYFLASPGGTPQAAETPLLKVKMLRYDEDVLGGSGNNDNWLFGIDILNAAGNSVVHYEKNIREKGFKGSPSDYEIELSLPDGTKLFNLAFTMDADSSYEKPAPIGGGQVDFLTVRALQEIPSIVQKLSGQVAGIPKSQALMEREAKLNQLKAIAASIPDSDPKKAEVTAAITQAESALKEDATVEEKVARDKQVEDALKLAQDVAGATGLSQDPNNWIGLSLQNLPQGTDLPKTIETLALFADQGMTQSIVFAKKLGPDGKTVCIKPAGLTAGLTKTFYLGVQPKDASGKNLDAGGKFEIKINNLDITELEVCK